MNIRQALVIGCSLAFGITGTAHADMVSDMKAQVDALQKQLEALKAQLDQVTTQVQQQKQVQDQQKQTQEQQAKNGGPYIQRKEGASTTFLTGGGGEVTLYGNLDVSLDTTTKGLASSYEQGGSPVGKMGWMPAISTNQSYLGVRGTHPIDEKLNFVWQLEAQIDISAEPGTTETNSNSSDQVKGGLFYRNSFIGFAGDDWGSIKIGKTDAPYKNSTARMNPFSGMLGDYQVIMGNTGGDNRVEFGTRIDHAIWYDSPNWNGFQFSGLVSPGQNRSSDNSLVASGEADCAGGNTPGSGALPPSCNDGSFGNAFSASASYTFKDLYLVAAYEQHNAVNRTSDTIGLPTTPPQDTQGDPNDVANENAWKLGVQYVFPTKTTVGFIYEKFKRNVPDYLEYQNERQRYGTWLVLTQALTERDVVSFGWAYAGSTPGDPGQHNTPTQANPDNAANMYTVAWKHALDRSTTIYADWAMTVNHTDAHYDLGAGGRAVTTDCHDASQLAAFDPTTGGVTGDGPHCFAGGKLQGVSVGVNYKF